MSITNMQLVSGLAAIYGVGGVQSNMKVRLMGAMSADSDTDTLSTHSELSGGGYSGPVTLGDAAISLGDGFVQVQWPEAEWLFTSSPSTDIGGYQLYYTDGGAVNRLVAQEKYSSPLSPVADDSVKIVPTIKFGTGVIT